MRIVFERWVSEAWVRRVRAVQWPSITVFVVVVCFGFDFGFGFGMEVGDGCAGAGAGAVCVGQLCSFSRRMTSHTISSSWFFVTEGLRL